MNVITNINYDTETKSKISTTGKVLLVGLTGGVAFGLVAICVPFITPALRKYCLPFIPATNNQVSNILKALDGKKGSLLDLGSGDGRIVIETAKKKFLSHGVELNPWLVTYSKINAMANGFTRGETKFFRKDLWRYNISNYDNIVIFGVEQMMQDLEKKFITECKSSCNIVACRFPLPNLTVTKTLGQGIDTVWVYKIK